MKNLVDNFEIVPLSDFKSFDGAHLITISGLLSDRFIADNNMVLVDNPDTGNRAGTFFKQSLRAVTDKLDPRQRSLYTARRPVMVLLFTDDQLPVLWGNTDQKVRLTITPAPASDILDFTRSALAPVF